MDEVDRDNTTITSCATMLAGSAMPLFSVAVSTNTTPTGSQAC